MDEINARRVINLGVDKVERRHTEDDRARVEAWLEDLGANLIGRESRQVCRTVPRRQIVIGASAILHHDRRLQQLHVEATAKSRSTVPWDGYERGEVDRAVGANEAYVALATSCDGAVLNGGEDGGVTDDGRVVDRAAERTSAD